VPWSKAANDDGTFRSDDELKDLYTEAGIALKEVVVDGGPEFRGAFARACARLGIEH